MLPHPTKAVTSAVTVADVLGFSNVEEASKSSVDSSRARKVSTRPEATSSSDIPPSVDDLDLSHLSPEQQVLVTDLLRQYEFVWSGSLGQMLTLEHHIDVLPEPCRFMVRPYRAGPAARQDIVEQIH